MSKERSIVSILTGIPDEHPTVRSRAKARSPGRPAPWGRSVRHIYRRMLALDEGGQTYRIWKLMGYRR